MSLILMRVLTLLTFKKYNKIENSNRLRIIEFVKEHINPDILWHITEKIHGANFSFLCDEEEVKVAKRSCITTSDFFSAQEVVLKYSLKVQHLYDLLKKDRPLLKSIQLYGELYGNGIQKEVIYGEKDFIVFDLLLQYGNKKYEYVDIELLKGLCDKVDIPFIPILKKDLTFNEALEYDEEFITLLNNKEDNYSEGIVIRPQVNLFLPKGSRILLKKKNNKFKERSSKKIKIKKVLDKENQKLLSLLLTYLNDNRVNSALSKIGEITYKDFGKLLKEVALDILNEIDLVKEIPKEVSKAFNKEVSLYLRKDFMNIIDRSNNE